ncbi:MAG: hypothetical protein F4Z02_12555 [Acidimicrobiia bacterium]|nr:hypothetical protein [Acidimicrobiia bacterium]MYG72750.1 hypothetical protein [Acidimicrobiia bacterium]
MVPDIAVHLVGERIFAVGGPYGVEEDHGGGQDEGAADVSGLLLPSPVRRPITNTAVSGLLVES